VAGRKSTIWGKIIKMAIQITSAATNGHTPRNTVLIGIPVIPESIKTFSPMGGVIKPISISITIITPYHIGSNPTAIITGKRIGTVITIHDTMSQNIPRMI
jgi:hypothetical protein